jgi:hypothetical protein
MSVKRLKRFLKNEQIYENDPEYRELENFYEEMKRKGWIMNSGFPIPPLDTIGRHINFNKR